jgi:hypothetical protein
MISRLSICMGFKEFLRGFSAWMVNKADVTEG